MDKKPYTFLLTFLHDLAFINFKLVKLGRTNRKIYFGDKFDVGWGAFSWKCRIKQIALRAALCARKEKLNVEGASCLQERIQDQALLQLRNPTTHRLRRKTVSIPFPMGEGQTDTPINHHNQGEILCLGASKNSF